MKLKKTKKQIRDLYHGKSGDIESESILVDSNGDKKDGYVSVWSDNNTISKILDRCGSAVIDYQEQGGGYLLKIDRRVFRGVSYCFKPIDKKEESEFTL